MLTATDVDERIVGDRYALEACLGEGSYGAVWAARDQHTGARVAVKLLHRDHLDSERVVARFEREGAIVCGLDHPNVAAAREVVPHDGGVALVLELVEGRTLREVLREAARAGRPLPVGALMALAAQLARGVAYAHGSGVVHRDLKPANVMITPDGRAVILDFGLARLLSPERGEADTTVGRVLGTPMYMSPEQAAGQVVGPEGDVFSLASVLFEAATLRSAWLVDLLGQRLGLATPVAGELRPNNAFGVIAARIAGAGERLDLRALRPDVPAPLAAWIEAASAADPTARPSVHALLAIAEGATPAEPAPLMPTAPIVRRRARASGAHDRVYVALAVVMATVGLLLAWLLLREEPVVVEVVEPPEHSVRASPPASPAAAAASPSASSAAPAAAVPRTASVTPDLAAAPTRTNERPIAGASFLRGCAAHDDACGADERPAAVVTVAPFSVDRTEVTAAAYDACVARGACSPAGTADPRCNGGRPGRADHPVNCVDAAQAAAFCAAHGARLPTASEWELAARSGSDRLYPWGDDAPSCARAHFAGCGEGTAPVGARTGTTALADLAGNVWEWTADGAPARREIRGGSFLDAAPALRASNRGWADARTRVPQLGFRCAR